VEPSAETETALKSATIFWFVFSSGGVVISVLAGVVWLSARPKSRAPRVFLTLVALGYTVVSIYPVPRMAARWMSAGFRPLTRADVPPGRNVVVLLGSGSYWRQDWSDASLSVLDQIGAERTLEAARLYRLVQPQWVISSGGAIDSDEPEDPVAVTMKETLVRLGVPLERIIVEGASTNTHDEATSVAAMLPSLSVDHVILVTSPIHMRRSVGTFRAVGVTVIPAIAREPVYSDWTLSVLPTQAGLRLAALVVHEALGLAYYKANGWYK
jgi:uncharacterized SAM-binding protein YcdF (DUF218 family)